LVIETVYFTRLAKVGKYYCKVAKLRNGVTCNDQSPNYNFGITPSATKNIERIKVVVFPNPANDQIRWNKNMYGKGYLVNLEGQKVAEQLTLESAMQIGHLSAGIYFLKFENNSAAVKVIKQ